MTEAEARALSVGAAIAEADPKTKQPKHKTAADAGKAAVAELNKQRGA